ncbi:hypothetical protein M501DRAFT_937207 [Patellaria atrata CBS 101060]|uniref:C2H2-type domain-containing protein n=1 Tax=Patellaria atrata CBS 101060 TaxID=1346257 RepID=A0A9P4S7K2_9PEZI|nr:hypothetical protein M501DRAFT_937207 [Patellaria atrata CBS 101060]
MVSSGQPLCPTDPQPSQLLQYLPNHHVLICAACGYAVQPNAISRHLKEIHRILRSRRKPYLEYASRFNLRDPADVDAPQTRDFPVPQLPVENGLICNHEGCFHLCVTIKRMKAHWNAIHNQCNAEISGWRSVPLQTFFRGIHLRYFTSPAYMHRLIDCSLSLSRLSLDSLDTVYLKHWISSTHLTIAYDQDTRATYRDAITNVAFHHPFLMHGLLSCAALHMAQLESDKREEHLFRAGIHQDQSIPLFRAAINSPTAENCDAIFSCSHLLVIHSLASECQDESLFLIHSHSETMIPTWLYFLRAGCEMVLNVWHLIEAGPVKSLALTWESPLPIPPDATGPLLTTLFSAIPPLESSKAWPEQVVVEYHIAAKALDTAFLAADALSEKFGFWDVLRLWPIGLSEEFMRLLREWHPSTLILLAHFSVLLNRVEIMHSPWFILGRARRLLKTVLCKLDRQWYPYIEVPLKDIDVSVH